MRKAARTMRKMRSKVSRSKVKKTKRPKAKKKTKGKKDLELGKSMLWLSTNP